MTERDRHVSHQRQIKDEIHELKLTGSELSNKFNEHKALQAAVENSRKDVVALKTRLKVSICPRISY